MLLSTKPTPTSYKVPPPAISVRSRCKRTQEPNDLVLFMETFFTLSSYQYPSPPLPDTFPACPLHLPALSFIHSWESLMSQRSSHFPQPGIKSQLTEAKAMSAIRGAESRDRAKDSASSLNKRASRKCPTYLLCLSSFPVLLALAWSPEFTFTFAIGESIKIPPDQAFLRSANPFALLFWNMGWYFSVENVFVINNWENG